jgi:hypothetical protein
VVAAMTSMAGLGVAAASTASMSIEIVSADAPFAPTVLLSD